MYTVIDDFSKAIFGGTSTDVKGGYKLMNTIAEAFCTWNASGSDGGAYQVVQDIYTIVAPLAMTLALCYMIIGILNIATRVGMDNLTFSLLLTPILRYVACLVVIKYGLQISGYLMAGSNSLVDIAIKYEPSSSSDFLGLSSDGLKTFNSMLPRILLELFWGIVSLLAQIYCGLLLAYQIITIRIEFLVRVAFMPLAIANIAQDGAQGAGVRYLKKLIGNMFMLMGILLTVRLTFYTLGSITMDNFKLFATASGNFEWIDQLIKGLLVTGLGPFCAVGAVTSFKAALSEMFA